MRVPANVREALVIFLCPKCVTTKLLLQPARKQGEYWCPRCKGEYTRKELMLVYSCECGPLLKVNRV